MTDTGRQTIIVRKQDAAVLQICDNTVFVKKHPALAELMADAPVGLPYEGAKEHYILDVENRALAARVIEILECVTPVSKRRAQKTYGIR